SAGDHRADPVAAVGRAASESPGYATYAELAIIITGVERRCMLKRPFAFAAAGLLALTAGACASDADADNADNGSSTTPTLDVGAAFYPLEFLASQVGGEHVAVTGLAPPGVDAHDLELTPSQVGEVDEA